jgi:hypothetical protein
MVTRALLIEAGPTPWDKEGRLVGNRPLPLATDALDAIRHLLQTIHEPVQGLYKPHGNEACDAVAKLLTQTFSLRAKEVGELDELDLGLWEGLKPAEVRSRFPRVFAQWMEKPLEVTPPDGEQLDKDGIPEGLWMRCPDCGDMLFRKVVEEALHVCPECQHHFRVSGPHAHRAAWSIPAASKSCSTISSRPIR